MTSTKKSDGSYASRIARVSLAHPIKLLLFTLILSFPLASSAHVNSPDVYFDGYAGQYRLLVTITPPPVVPGMAEIQIRCAETDVQQIKVLPLKMVGVAAELAPTPDLAERSETDPHLFHGKLWIMTRGSWKIQIQAEGSKGQGELFVPLPAVSTYSGKMHTALGALLAVLGLVLVAGIVGIVGAAAREASLPSGQEPAAQERRRGHRREAVACVLVLAALVLGDRWWRADAATNARLNYKVPHVTAQLQNGGVLDLSLAKIPTYLKWTIMAWFQPTNWCLMIWCPITVILCISSWFARRI